MPRITANDDLLGDSETEHYGEIGKSDNHRVRTRMQQQTEREQAEEAEREEVRKENERRQLVGKPPINTESPFGRGSDIDRLAQQGSMDEADIREKVRAYERRLRGAR